MDPKLPVSKLPYVGNYYSHKLKRLNIQTLEDLIYHFPFRYDDFSAIKMIEQALPDEKLSIQGVIWDIGNFRSRSGKFITRAVVTDQSGSIEAIWFNQPYLTKTLKTGTLVSLSGKLQMDGHRLKLISPSYEITKSQPSGQLPTIHTGRLVPVYPETEGISSKWLRAKIAAILPHYLKTLKDFLPEEIKTKLKLEELRSALLKIHFPKNANDVENAKKRLSFDELFLVQLAAALRKKDWSEKKKAPPMKIDKIKIDHFIENLPFELTHAQIKAISEIIPDMQKTIPANRLLEGDVGSGKTVVAAICAYFAYLNEFETILAAPTEILAFQHQATLQELLSPYGITVGIWTKSKKIKGDITCGTHALLTTFKANKQVGMVVVDEQHRFGVAQRAKLFLSESQKLTPHLLTMTATPIPRTLALTLYGDLDLSVLDEMPKGRKKIATFVVPRQKREAAYKFIEKHIKAGRQTFIITPFVEKSETMATVKAAVVEFEKLRGKFKKGIKLGLLHGKLKSKEKEAVIKNFKAGKINILVATPVVEVGIDIPNATIMMIESAERFGLAQLHQLRGRVGRGKHQSYCLLFTDSQSENSLKRLKSMEKIHVGFDLAEIDLKMRGPGEIFGLKQSGFVNLKLADITDHELVAFTQREAKKIIERDPLLKNHPLLDQKLSQLQSEYVQPN